MNCKWYCRFENEGGALSLGVGRLFIKIPLWDIFGDSRTLSTRCHVMPLLAFLLEFSYREWCGPSYVRCSMTSEHLYHPCGYF